MIMEDLPEPFLPPELERKIFEMAFDPNDPCTAKLMLFVAKRILEWIRPLMYSVFDQGCIKPFPDFGLPTTPNAKEIGTYARSMLLGHVHKSPEDICDFLRHSPNVRNLAVWYNQPLRHIIPALKRLQNLRILSGDFDNIPREEPPFVNLTQMEMLEPSRDFPFDVLGSFSCLTHLSMYCFAPQKYDARVLADAIDSCSQLIVCCLYSSSGVSMNPEICGLVQERDRIVMLDSTMSNTDDWISGAYGFLDCWQYAERVVVARKSNYFKAEVPHNQYFNLAFDWCQNLTERGMECIKKVLERIRVRLDIYTYTLFDYSYANCLNTL
ncbi:hypothetical protein BJ165DRAFT_1553907 [Panaeolus papilionaceus]|nr:hypothetical protein BJ165DRAFT_1553907 [Panaeolus papilionaceus]